MLKRIVLALGVIATSGCATNGKFAADNLIPDKAKDRDLRSVDIAGLLVDSKGACIDNQMAPASSKGDSLKFTVDEALAKCGGRVDATTRNRIQDRLILASNALCEDYKVTLKKKQSRINFWLGLAATGLSGAGAVVKSVGAAHHFAAAAGLSSGARAEYNQDYFADVNTQVITNGITKRRKDILDVITSARDQDLKKYTLEAAIGDVVTYHGACSLVAGLEQANGALTKQDCTLGLDVLNAVLAGKGMPTSNRVACTPQAAPASAPAPTTAPHPVTGSNAGG